MSERSDYPNIVVAGVWPTKNGHFNTAAIDTQAFEKLSQYAEVGGKFLIRKRSEASMSKSRNPEQAPPYYLEFVPAAEVEKFKANKPQRGL